MEDTKKAVRYSLIFDDDITEENVQSLIDKIHEKTDVDLYFSTLGGCMKSMDVLTAYLNKRDDITIYLDCILMSAGFDLLFSYEGKIKVSKSFECAAIHKIDAQNYSRRKDEMINHQERSINRRNKDFFNWLKKDFKATADELKRYSEGEDVYFSKTRIEKFIKGR